MSTETIDLTIDARGVAFVTLQRPEKHNALNALMIKELTQMAQHLGQAQTVRVVVLAGAGKSFCAGGDLGWMKETMAKDRTGKMAQAEALAAMLGAWNDLPKPVVAQVHGAVYGGGVGLLSVCDIIVAAEDTRFALTETRLGLIPATIGPFVVARLGQSFARQVFFNSKPFTADLLYRAGLVAHICPLDDLPDAVEAEVLALLQCAPGAVAQAKALCLSLAGVNPITEAKRTAGALADCWETTETRDGIEAFFAKKTPPWRQDS